MTSPAPERDVELIAARQERASATLDHSNWGGGVDMNGKRPVDPFKHALFNHVAGAVEALFTRLKHETNTTAWPSVDRT